MEGQPPRNLTAGVWTGCCGWTSARARYFREFPAIELQSTFYQPPSAALAEKWKRQAPDGFRFCMKAWQLITHAASSPTYRRLKTPLPEKSKAAVGGFQPTEEVWNAWRTTLEVARALQAAVIVFQCPASFRPAEQNLKNLEAFFRKLAACPSLVAWEPRGPWPQDVVRDLCSRFGVIHCVDPFAHDPATAGVRYFRLHGRGGYNYQYTEAELRELKTKALAGGAFETYVLFNNVPMRQDAARFLSLLNQGTPAPAA